MFAADFLTKKKPKAESEPKANCMNQKGLFLKISAESQMRKFYLTAFQNTAK